MIPLIFLSFLCHIYSTSSHLPRTATPTPTCWSPLGVSDGTVKDDHLSASSSFSANTVGARNGRLGTERGGGAWCPASLVTEETGMEEWLQIDLGREQVVVGVITQGRYAGGQGRAELGGAYLSPR